MLNPTNRYLTAAEAGPVPWIEPGLFDCAIQPERFNPADFDGFEIAACCTWADVHGSLSTERRDVADDDAPVTMWSLFLHRITGGVDCVADLSSEAACIALAAALSAQYGIEPGANSDIEAALIATGAARFVIEPQRDEYRGEGQDGETHFGPCSDSEAETFAVFRYEPGAPRGDAIGADEFPSRAEAVAFINSARQPRY